MRSRHLPFCLSAVVTVMLLALASLAQTNTWNGNKINGVPASVTSFGFGGRPGFHGVPPSVTSLNFGQIPHPGGFHPLHGVVNGHHHRRLVSPFFGPTFVPYAYPAYVMPTYDTYDNSMEDMGPDRTERTAPDAAEEVRQELESLKSTVLQYRDELRGTGASEQTAPKPEPEQAAVKQPQTVLVFKDGRKLDVENYAIVGGTLYDLSAGRTKKVALAELDLEATVKQNDDRGVEFRVPAASN